MQVPYFLFLLLPHISVASNAIPEIVVHPNTSEPLNYEEGENVILNCSAVGVLRPSIQWYKDGRPLLNDSMTFIYEEMFQSDNNSTTSTLELYRVGGDDTGNYSCQAMNEVGTTSAVEFEIKINLAFRLFKFSQTSYNGSEDDGFIPVCMDLVNGTLTENITIVLKHGTSNTNSSSFGLPKLTYRALEAQSYDQTNDTQMCADISINNDNVLEDTEKFVICASTEQDYVTVISEDCVDIYIKDNDFAQFQFLNTSYNVSEDSGNVSVCLEFVNGTTEGVRIALSTDANLTNDSRIAFASQPLASVQGHQVCFDITVVDDDLVESTEQFAICGCSPQNAVMFNGCSNLIIQDNDVAKFQFFQSLYNVSENDGAVTVCLELVKGILTEDVIIELNLAANDTTATARKDFMGLNNLTFVAGSSQVCLNFSIVDDDIIEGEEKFVICGSSKNPSAIVRENNCTVVYIADNDDIEVLPIQLENVTKMLQNLTNDAVEIILSQVSQFIRESEGNIIDQTGPNLKTISNILSNITNFVLEKEVQITKNTVGNMTQSLNSLLHWIPSAFEIPTSSRTVEIFEELVSHYAQQVPENRLDQPQVFNFTSLTLVTERSSKSNLTSSGTRFSNGGGILPRQEDSTNLLPHQDTAIALPASLFKQIDGSSISTFFGFYETAALFPINRTSNASRQIQVISPVLAATVVTNLTNRRDSENVTITFRLQNKTDMFVAFGSEKCVSWDFDRTMWITNGCTKSTSKTQDGVVSCHCNHLTNFAILADVCPVQRDCLNVSELLETLDKSFNNLTAGNYEEAVFNLSQIVQRSESMVEEQNSDVLNKIADYFKNLEVFLADLNINISIEVVNSTTQVINSLLQWEPSNINGHANVAKSSRILQSFELVLSHFAQQLPPNESRNIMLPLLTVVVESMSIRNLSMNGRSFVIGDINDLELRSEVQPDEISPEQDAINLPPSLFEHDMISGHNNNTGLLFMLYNNSILFPVNGGNDLNSDGLVQTVVGSRIIAATVTVGDVVELRDLEDNVTVVLQLLNSEQNIIKLECVSWNFTLKNWSAEGCTTNDSQNGTIICSCNHLTSFAVLVDICQRQDNCEPQNDITLTIISYIGISISIVCLLITIVSLFMFKIVRQKDISKYHIQLSLALLFMLTVALVLVAFSSAKAIPPYGGCVTISILVHYFTLVSVMWMGAEALLMFQKLVFVFSQITTKIIVTVSTVCWTVPIVLVVIPLIVDTAMGNDIESDIIVNRDAEIPFCFLSHPGAFWGAFLTPILAVMIFNVVMFVCVIVVLVRHDKNKAARLKEDIGMKTILRRMISISGVMFLFGLTWLFAVFTFNISVSEIKKTFEILFVLFNSFQGLFIFFFFIVLNREIIESWKELLSCGRYQSKLLGHSHPKTKPKQNNSGNTGLTSRSGVKSTSEPLKPDFDTNALKNTELKPGSKIIKIPSLESAVEPDTSESDKLSIKTVTVTSNKNTVTIEVVSDDSNNEEEVISPKVRIKRYTTRREFKHHVEQIEVDFYSDDDSDTKDDDTNQI